MGVEYQGNIETVIPRIILVSKSEIPKNITILKWVLLKTIIPYSGQY